MSTTNAAAARATKAIGQKKVRKKRAAIAKAWRSAQILSLDFTIVGGSKRASPKADPML